MSAALLRPILPLPFDDVLRSEYWPGKSRARSTFGLRTSQILREINPTSFKQKKSYCVAKRLLVEPDFRRSFSSEKCISRNYDSLVAHYAPSMPRLEDTDPVTMLLQQRIIFLGTQVDDNSADIIISQLLLLDAQDPTQDIKLFINSPGGSVTAGMGIYDAMKLCRADVSTVCFGLAASMGAFLLAAGTKGKRFSMPNARIMIHQPLGGGQGSAIDVGLQAREMMYHKVKLNKILSRVTGKSEEQIEEDTDRDNFLTSWEAMEYGIVDAVIDSDRPDLVAPIGVVEEPPKTRVNELWTIKEGKERRQLPGESRDVQAVPV